MTKWMKAKTSKIREEAEKIVANMMTMKNMEWTRGKTSESEGMLANTSVQVIMTNRSRSSQVAKEGTDTRLRWTTRKLISAQSEKRIDTRTQWMTKRTKNNHHAVKMDERILKNDRTPTGIR